VPILVLVKVVLFNGDISLKMIHCPFINLGYLTGISTLHGDYSGMTQNATR
jgi:hypothetical protein